MEKLNREEVLCLIRKMGGVAIKLENTSIHAIVIREKYVNFLTELNIEDLKYVAGSYIRSVAKVFDYKGVIEYNFAFDSIIIAAKATIVNDRYIESATINETETLIDNRCFEDNDDDDDCLHSEYDEIDREIDEEEERERKEMEELDAQYAEEYNNEYDDTYDDYHCDDDYPYIDDDEEQTQCSSKNTTEEDLDDCLSKN